VKDENSVSEMVVGQTIEVLPLVPKYLVVHRFRTTPDRWFLGGLFDSWEKASESTGGAGASEYRIVMFELPTKWQEDGE
jgi:hypothetical protein